VFADPFVAIVWDRVESGEQRWHALGVVEGFLLLLVAHAVLEEGDEAEVIHIISARKATRAERKIYENENL
jgi:uncharacterized protein